MIDEQRDGSEANDSWLFLLLGSIALADRLTAWMESDAERPHADVTPGDDTGAALDLLLGALSLRRTLLAALLELAAAAPPLVEIETPPRASPAGLLR